MRLHYYILIGLALWGLPALLVVGPEILPLVAFAGLPVWLASRRWGQTRSSLVMKNDFRAGVVIVVVLLYLASDSLFGRQKFAQNLFLSRAALDNTIETINESVSRGRSLVEIIGGVSIFVPFALFDLARDRTRSSLRAILWSVATVFLFYDVGVSRGYALMAVAAIVVGSGANVFQFVCAGGISLFVFMVASVVRGDFNEVAFSNPLFDAIIWPFINLGLLVNADCGNDTWTTFVGEFFKKFAPSFVLSKDIFSFNVEMTRCVYPFFEQYIESVSVFTYLGEFQYYAPSATTGLVAGLILAFLCQIADRMLVRQGLTSTRVFAGLICIVLLRSRVLDVASVLIFLLIFATLWRVLLTRVRRGHPAEDSFLAARDLQSGDEIGAELSDVVPKVTPPS